MRIESRIEEIREKAVIFRFAFFPEEGEEFMAEGTANLVVIDRTWRPRALPERVKQALSQEKENES